MITDADITKLKKTFATKEDLKRFATKEELKKESSSLRAEMSEMRDTIDTVAATIARLESGFEHMQNTLDGIAGAIQDQRVENGAGAVHLARHDRQIEALALATHVPLPD
jgi:archaellum component FlaC